jgi:hypothetical protein
MLRNQIYTLVDTLIEITGIADKIMLSLSTSRSERSVITFRLCQAHLTLSSPLITILQFYLVSG